MIWTQLLTTIFFTGATLAGFAKIALVWLDFRKRHTFRMYSHLVMACLFTCAMASFAIGHMFALRYFVSTGFFMVSFWALGNIWIQFSDVTVPGVVDKLILWLLAAVPFSPFVLFLVRWSWTAPVGINFNTQLVWLNLIASFGIFLVWLVSFMASRLRSFYMFWSVTFLFFAMAALSARLDLSDTWTLASSILYFSGTLTYLYTWVNHGQNS